MNNSLDPRAALEFVRLHGVVLASAKGDAPRLIEAILGEPIGGNWWVHPRSRFIYNVLAGICESEDVLVCRLLHAKVTLVHRRLWPALVRVAERFEPAQLAQVREEHMPNGRHVTTTVAFPSWVPPCVSQESRLLSEEDAFAALGPAVGNAQPGLRGPRKRRQQRASNHDAQLKR